MAIQGIQFWYHHF